jgi:Tol biopolymer transport system component
LKISSIDPTSAQHSEVVRLNTDTTGASWFFDISYDGKRVAVSDGPEGPIRIFSMLGHLERIVPVTGVNRIQSLHWTADGSGFYLSNALKDGTILLHVDLHGKTNVIWDNRGGAFTMGVPSPDGHYLAIQGSTSNQNMWMMENF